MSDIVRAMETELMRIADSVAGKIEQVAQLAERLRADNAALRLRLVAVETERDKLQARTVAARERVESLLERIPGEAGT
ncbi:MAG: hypothetical protein LBO79_08435 [Zoogloeaceae bacterium]|jgi:uncharacterized protein (TIGR02449 family)|nr:hypothetical protein [Zoogloeaceae bacterium]